MAQQKNPYEDDPLGALIKQSMVGQEGLPGDPSADPNAPLVKPGDQDPSPVTPDPTRTTEPVVPPIELPDPAVPVTPAAPTWNKGVNKNNGMIQGYDLDKLNDKTYTSGKYNSRVRAFSEGLKNDVGVSRGGLDNMTNFLKANGFPNAKMVGDDKIDFGDGAGPIDVIRGDGEIVFQDPDGVDPNAVANAQAAEGGSGSGSNGSVVPTLGLEQNGVPSDTAFFNQLMEAARKAAGGGTDRKALLDRMGLS